MTHCSMDGDERSFRTGGDDLKQWFPTFFCSRDIFVVGGHGGHKVDFFYIQLH